MAYKNALAVLVLAGLAAPTGAQHCGKERWSVKTGTDIGAAQVNVSDARTVRITDLIALQPPNPLPADTRFSPTENTVFVVEATLTDFKLETGATGDSDYHLVLQDDQGNTMVAEIPFPGCVGASSPFAGQIASARTKFDAQFTATPSFQTANIPVRVTGVGFFDFFHNQHGAAPNVIELHPVLDIVFNPGPAEGDFTLSVSSSAMHLHGGSSSSVAVVAAPVKGSVSPAVGLTVSGLPSGVGSQVSQGMNGQANLTLTARPDATNGTLPVVVTASANGRSHSQTIALNVSSLTPGTEELQWEYKLISAASEEDVVDQANQLGAHGWDMNSGQEAAGRPGTRRIGGDLLGNHRSSAPW